MNDILKLYNPNDMPFGQLSNNYVSRLNINGKKWQSVTNYVLSNLLITPLYRRKIELAPINNNSVDMPMSVLKQVVERKVKINEEVNKEKGRAVTTEQQDTFRDKEFEIIKKKGLQIYDKFNGYRSQEFIDFYHQAILNIYTKKLNESPELKQALINTHPRHISFLSTDNVYLGVNPNPGKGFKGYNLVGLSLLELRGRFITEIEQKKRISEERRLIEFVSKFNAVKNYLANLVIEGVSLYDEFTEAKDVFEDGKQVRRVVYDPINIDAIIEKYNIPVAIDDSVLNAHKNAPYEYNLEMGSPGSLLVHYIKNQRRNLEETRLDIATKYFVFYTQNPQKNFANLTKEDERVMSVEYSSFEQDAINNENLDFVKRKVLAMFEKDGSGLPQELVIAVRNKLADITIVTDNDIENLLASGKANMTSTTSSDTSGASSSSSSSSREEEDDKNKNLVSALRDTSQPNAPPPAAVISNPENHMADTILIYENDEHNTLKLSPYTREDIKYENITFPNVASYIFTYMISRFLVVKGKRTEPILLTAFNVLKPKIGTSNCDSACVQFFTEVYNEHYYTSIKDFVSTALRYKFKSNSLKELLILTKNKHIVWNDPNDNILGCYYGENDKNNIVGKELERIRTKLQTKEERSIIDKNILKYDSIYNLINQDPFIIEWVSRRLADYCENVSRVRSYLRASINIQQNYNVEFVKRVLDHIYKPCSFVEKHEKLVHTNARIPDYFTTILDKCKYYTEIPKLSLEDTETKDILINIEDQKKEFLDNLKKSHPELTSDQRKHFWELHLKITSNIEQYVAALRPYNLTREEIGILINGFNQNMINMNVRIGSPEEWAREKGKIQKDGIKRIGSQLGLGDDVLNDARLQELSNDVRKIIEEIERPKYTLKERQDKIEQYELKHGDKGLDDYIRQLNKSELTDEEQIRQQRKKIKGLLDIRSSRLESALKFIQANRVNPKYALLVIYAGEERAVNIIDLIREVEKEADDRFLHFFGYRVKGDEVLQDPALKPSVGVVDADVLEQQEKEQRKKLNEIKAQYKSLTTEFVQQNQKISNLYWNRIATTLLLVQVYLNATKHDPKELDVKRFLIDSLNDTLVTNVERNILTDERSNCILNALLNILTGVHEIISYYNQGNSDTIFARKTFILIASILLNRQVNGAEVKKLEHSNFYMVTAEQLEDDVEEKKETTVVVEEENVDAYYEQMEDEEENDEDEDVNIEEDEEEEYEYDGGNEYEASFAFNEKNAPFTNNEVRLVSTHLLEIVPSIPDIDVHVRFLLGMVMVVRNDRGMKDAEKNARINFFNSIN